ncbi:hypothetical protein [Roseicitreum antarcticum]|uniref:FlgN protein n=1 Tax=Roseicitreum antarcticum TaxID=564137 RepID=A0A1H2XAR6_9RHOB|nr:hypothetical protein [Roseicitreum antarcticum]SDW89930.1 hypothetical protein SAMN04488238_104128 [Roseicitreum antarcticum]
MAAADRLSRRMLRVLEEERGALLAANFAALPGLLTRKEKLLTALTQLDPAEIDPEVEVRLIRNQALLRASMEGIATARAAFAGLKAGAEFRTYDRRGNSRAVSAPRASVQHRA